MNSADAAWVKRLYSEIVAGRCAGCEESLEKLRIRDGAIAFAAGPALDSAAEMADVDSD